MTNDYLDDSHDAIHSDRRILVHVSMQPGFLRDSLITILQSFRFVLLEVNMPHIGRCEKNLTPPQPQIVLVDCSQNNTGWVSALGKIRAGNPQVRCLAIVDTFLAGKEALKNGADEVLHNGFSSHDLGLALLRLAPLTQKNTFQSVERKG